MTLPATIQAIAIKQTGGFEVLEKLALPFPQVQQSDIVIKTEYLGVNFIDTYCRSGLYPLPSFPGIPGREATGTIVALPTDPEVLNNPTYQGNNFRIGGKVAVESPGTHSDYISVPWKNVYPVPDSVSTLQAAAVLQALTVVSFMEEAYNVQKGDVVLIHTVAGGLGTLFTQYAKHLGATVIGTTSSPEKAQLARSVGADHVILYPVEDTVQRVLEITNGEGVHAIFDGVGKDTFENNFKLIRRKGTMVCLGNASGPIPPFPPLKLAEKNIKIARPAVFNYTTTAEEAQYFGRKAFDLIASGVLKIRIFKEYPFTAEGTQQAHRDLVGGKTTGKLVIRVAEN